MIIHNSLSVLGLQGLHYSLFCYHRSVHIVKPQYRNLFLVKLLIYLVLRVVVVMVGAVEVMVIYTHFLVVPTSDVSAQVSSSKFCFKVNAQVFCFKLLSLCHDLFFCYFAIEYDLTKKMYQYILLNYRMLNAFSNSFGPHWYDYRTFSLIDEFTTQIFQTPINVVIDVMSEPSVQWLVVIEVMNSTLISWLVVLKAKAMSYQVQFYHA